MSRSQLANEGYDLQVRCVWLGISLVTRLVGDAIPGHCSASEKRTFNRTPGNTFAIAEELRNSTLTLSAKDDIDDTPSSHPTPTFNSSSPLPVTNSSTLEVERTQLALTKGPQVGPAMIPYNLT